MIFIYSASIIYLSLIIIFLLISLIQNIKITILQWRMIFGFTTISLACIAYGTFPNIGSDLSRYFIELDQMKYRGFNYAINDSLYKETPLTSILFYTVSKLENNHLLPFISSFLTYSILFLVIIKLIKKFQINNNVISIFLLFLIAIISVRSSLTGVRQHLALVMMLLAVYVDFFSNRKNMFTFFLYLLPLFIHVGALPIVVIRILYSFKDKFFKLRYALLFWTLLIPSLSFLLANTNSYLSYSYEKLLTYQESDFSDFRILIVRVFSLILLIYITKVTYNNKEKLNNLLLTNYYRFYILLLFFTVGSLPISHLFSRMLNFTVYMSLPILFIYFQGAPRNYKSLVTFIFLFIIVGLLLYQVVDARTSWRLLI